MIMKKIIVIMVIFLIFYIFLFYISKNVDKNYILGFGWKAYLKESKTIIKNLKIGEIKDNEEVFIKSIKIPIETEGLLSFELKKELTKINLDRYFSDLIKVISKKSGDVYIKVQFEEKSFDFINYAFGLPIRIYEIKVKIPINILEILVE